MRILITDDSRTQRVALTDYLRQMGHTVIEATDGPKAIELYETTNADLILLDVEMPGMNGFETARRIRAKGGDQGWIPIIFLSASIKDQDVAAGIDAGGDDYLSKPVSPVVLRAKINAMERITDMRTRLLKATQELSVINASLREESAQDGLTGIPNRRSFDTALDQEWKHGTRTGHSVALLLCDVDYFKKYNDTYGHQKGDECLKAVASAIREAARRAVDMVARYGGEEFAVLLPDTSPVSALLVAGRILEVMRGKRVPHEGAPAGHVTISIGVCATVPEPGHGPEALLRCADKALYSAKNKGRNQAVVLTYSA